MNPYAIIAGLVIYGASVTGAAWLGYDYRDGKVAQEIVEKQREVLTAFADTVEQDKAASIKRAEQNTAAQERAKSARMKGLKDANEKARAECGRDATSLGLLNDAIDAANRKAGSR